MPGQDLCALVVRSFPRSLQSYFLIRNNKFQVRNPMFTTHNDFAHGTCILFFQKPEVPIRNWGASCKRCFFASEHSLRRCLLDTRLAVTCTDIGVDSRHWCPPRTPRAPATEEGMAPDGNVGCSTVHHVGGESRCTRPRDQHLVAHRPAPCCGRPRS